MSGGAKKLASHRLYNALSQSTMSHLNPAMPKAPVPLPPTSLGDKVAGNEVNGLIIVYLACVINQILEVDSVEAIMD